MKLHCMPSSIMPKRYRHATVGQLNPNASLENSPQALGLSILRTAIRHGESTFCNKFLAKFIEIRRGKFAPIVRKPFTDNTTGQLVFPLFDKIIKVSAYFAGVLALQEINFAIASGGVNEAKNIFKLAGNTGGELSTEV